jgi:hypothetical protein
LLSPPNPHPCGSTGDTGAGWRFRSISAAVPATARRPNGGTRRHTRPPGPPWP